MNPAQIQQNGTATEKRRSRIKRPLNAFMLWSRYRRKKLYEEGTMLHDFVIRRIIANEWKQLSFDEKWPFFDEAVRQKEQHLRDHPYVIFPTKRKAKATGKHLSSLRDDFPPNLSYRELMERMDQTENWNKVNRQGSCGVPCPEFDNLDQNSKTTPASSAYPYNILEYNNSTSFAAQDRADNYIDSNSSNFNQNSLESIGQIKPVTGSAIDNFMSSSFSILSDSDFEGYECHKLDNSRSIPDESMDQYDMHLPYNFHSTMNPPSSESPNSVVVEIEPEFETNLTTGTHMNQISPQPYTDPNLWPMTQPLNSAQNSSPFYAGEISNGYHYAHDAYSTDVHPGQHAITQPQGWYA